MPAGCDSAGIIFVEFDFRRLFTPLSIDFAGKLCRLLVRGLSSSSGLGLPGADPRLLFVLAIESFDEGPVHSPHWSQFMIQPKFLSAGFCLSLANLRRLLFALVTLVALILALLTLLALLLAVNVLRPLSRLLICFLVAVATIGLLVHLLMVVHSVLLL